MPTYTFKLKPESVWFVLATVFTAGAAYFATNTTPPEDWRPLLIGLAGAIVRPLVGLLLPGPATT